MAQELDLFIQSVPYNPVFDRGADTVYGLQLRDMNQKPIDLRGYSAKLTIYPYQRAAAKENPTIYDTLSTDDGRIYGKDEDGEKTSLNESGVIWVEFPKDVTKGYKWNRGWYKLEITSVGGYVYRVADGDIAVRD